ncbi:nucleolar and coiled-body phosphoprotein 1 [Aplysia californica]|uniref:Nucleolar and coiled-body phosphoprotein 1 n=1 Tax=Aplysia californica TaxID=6500 RepID=A0ABM0JFF3_APLCA|nr:nucleolar and coiled-body phosphoprotein 1 [Aplysia californica]
MPEVTVTSLLFSTVCAPIAIIIMTSIFLCCWGRKSSAEIKDKGQPVKEKSPSPQAEEKNGTTGPGNNFVSSSEDLGDFSAVQRETEILRSYRRPQAPRKKGRHSRAPRAMTQSMEQLDVFGELAEEDDEQSPLEDLAQEKAERQPLVGAAQKEESDEKEEEEVTIRDNTDKNQDKRDTRSSMLADIEQTLASMHLQQEEGQQKQQADGDGKEDAKPTLSPIASVSSEAASVVAAATSAAGELTNVEAPSNDVFEESATSKSIEAAEGDNIVVEVKRGDGEDKEQDTDGEDKLANDKPAVGAKGSDKDSNNAALLPPETSGKEKEEEGKEESKTKAKDVSEEKGQTAVEVQKASAAETSAAQSEGKQGDDDGENEAPSIPVEAPLTKVSTPPQAAKISNTAEKSPNADPIVPVSEEMTRSSDLSTEATPSSSDIPHKAKVGHAKVPPKVSPKPSPKARAAAEAVVALRLSGLEQDLGGQGEAAVSGGTSVVVSTASPSSEAKKAGVEHVKITPLGNSALKNNDSVKPDKNEPVITSTTTLNSMPPTTPVKSSIKDSTNKSASDALTKSPTPHQPKQPVSGIPTKSGAGSKPTSPVVSSPTREAPPPSNVATPGMKTIQTPTPKTTDATSKPANKAEEDSDSGVSAALTPKPQPNSEKTLPAANKGAAEQQQTEDITDKAEKADTKELTTPIVESSTEEKNSQAESPVNNSEAPIADKPTSLALADGDEPVDTTAEQKPQLESPSETKDTPGRQRRESDEGKGKRSKIPLRAGSKSRSSPPKSPSEEKPEESEST